MMRLFFCRDYHTENNRNLDIEKENRKRKQRKSDKKTMKKGDQRRFKIVAIPKTTALFPTTETRTELPTRLNFYPPGDKEKKPGTSCLPTRLLNLSSVLTGGFPLPVLHALLS